MPAPPEPVEPGRPTPAVFHDGVLLGEAMRIVALRHEVLDGERPRAMLVQVAETLEARRQLTRRQVLQAAAVQLALIVFAAGLIAYGVRRGLAPLKRLRAEVRARHADDLTPIGTRDVPREVAPLIHAINAHTQRQRQLSELQLRFVANASHQLKTPLTVLRAQIDHALQQNELPAMRDVLQQVDESARGTQRMVSQLLSLARSDPGLALEQAPVDLVALAHDATFEMLPAARESGIDLGFEAAAEVHVLAERVLLREAVVNLVHNAIVYTAAGRAAAGAARGGVVTVSVDDTGGTARLSVVDDGPGIAPEERTRVLERFYRGAGAGGTGSGLGLSIVKEICDRHGIALQLLDGPGGRGLCVRLTWPGPATPGVRSQGPMHPGAGAPGCGAIGEPS